MSGSLDTSCQSISKLHFNLTVSELTRPNAPTVLGVQSLLGCPFGKGWSSMLGAGIQTPNNGYIFLGMNYTFGPHL